MLKILVVEDSPDNQMLFKRILVRSGAEADIAVDGAEGVEFALANTYDVVLMDIQMPRMDGTQAARKLRQAGYKVPIIALTAHAMKEERDRALRAGFSDFLSKPFQRDVLIEALLKHVHGQSLEAKLNEL